MKIKEFTFQITEYDEPYRGGRPTSKLRVSAQVDGVTLNCDYLMRDDVPLPFETVVEFYARKAVTALNDALRTREAAPAT